MGFHVTARLAWHADGWNGHVCSEPQKNTYCVGSHSYPGDMIAEQRDLEWEKGCAAGRACSALDRVPPCIYSINAFGSDSAKAYAKPPVFFTGSPKTREWPLPPSTVCVWPYEEMYREEVRSGQSYDAQERKKFSDEFFSKIEKKSSLIFYYANYSNPFSTDEDRRYVLIGLSRVADVGDDMFYEGCDARTIEKYGGYVWDRTITSSYPTEGLRLPYHLYKDDPRLESFVVFPDNPILCKYGSKLITDDDALGLVEQFHASVLKLIELGDTSENWEVRRKWLEEVISELWQRRGAYPGMPEVCTYLGFQEAIPYLKRQVGLGKELKAVEEIWKIFDGRSRELGPSPIPQKSLDALRRNWKLKEAEEQELLRNVLSRIDVDRETIAMIIDEPRIRHGLNSSLPELADNPYLLVEQYVGNDPDDRLTWGQLDRAMLPSPELGVSAMVEGDSAKRLRALACECLMRVSGHTFLPVPELVALVNGRLASVPEWKQLSFKSKYFEVDAEDYQQALSFREEEGTRCVYLLKHYEAEQQLESQLGVLMQRPDIALKIPVTEEHWREYLFDRAGDLAKNAKVEYEQAIASQATACQQIFRRGLAILCGAAGTGKTTALRALVKAIRKVDGVGAAVIALAPTGKAADRAREVFESDPVIAGSIETATIHSFLAKRGWLNDNLTLRVSGGQTETSYATVIIDECSMLDLGVFSTLFKSIKWSTVKRLILVGDPNQLPPIGTGRVFADVVEYCRRDRVESIAELTANLRQMEGRVTGEGTGIVDLASLFRSSSLQEEKSEDADSATEQLLQRVQASGEVDKDLRVLYWNESEALAPMLLQQLKEDMAADAKVDGSSIPFYELWGKASKSRPEYSQILSPYRGELYGIEALNQAIQQHKLTDSIRQKGLLDGVALFDKVIQLRNRTVSDPIYGYDHASNRIDRYDAFNGELGYVVPHRFDSGKWKSPFFRVTRFAVSFSRKPDISIYYGRELDEKINGKYIPSQRVEENLELGYAISVHKAQGSEFDHIYVVVPAAKRQMLSQELLYTALTRGKKHCTLLIQRDAGVLIDIRRRERRALSRINSSLFGWHLAPALLQSSEGWYEAGKIHEALTGDMVRSKSEVIIANMLQERGMEFFYEKPLFAPDGTMYLPDFTLTWNGEEIYWEHVGMLSNPKYVEHWEKKSAWYEKHFSGCLRTTFESSSGMTIAEIGSKQDISAQADAIIKSLMG